MKNGNDNYEKWTDRRNIERDDVADAVAVRFTPKKAKIALLAIANSDSRTVRRRRRTSRQQLIHAGKKTI
ncbi:hypothetical protein L596_024679 [Steinernema carpocapsae]|uniref:Uncharacterized protein n=1 Tax=Steinernema carpocapsae TaxID=34508 RepID=A0A4U5M5F5_STECR|nr:hypothetical protein L596_024679 [Steinernema carpocapsae]